MSDNDKSKSIEKNINVRRSALKKLAGGGVVGVLTLAHRPALGAVCLPSGHISSATHVSAMLRHGEAYDESEGSGAGGCGGLSEGAWKNPYNGAASSWENKDGGPADWAKTSYRPNKPNKKKEKKQKIALDDWKNRFDPLDLGLEASDFDEVFIGSFGSESMEDVLSHRGNSMKRVATQALLNAELFGWDGFDAVHPEDVIGLYDAVMMGTGTYTLQHGVGSTVTFDQIELYNFFKGLIH